MGKAWTGRWVLAVVAAALLAGSAVRAQDVYIEQSVEMSGLPTPAAGPMVMKIWFTPDRMRIEQPFGGGTIVIVRSDLGKIWILSSAAKTCMEQSLEAMKASAATAAAMMGGDKMQVDLKATGNTKKIGDWNCQEHLLSVTGGLPITMQIWASPDVKVDPALYSKMTEAMGSNPMMGPLTEKIKTIQGYPVQTVTKTALGSQVVESSTTVQKISMDKIDASVFEVPEGYTKVDAPAAPVAPQTPAPR